MSRKAECLLSNRWRAKQRKLFGVTSNLQCKFQVETAFEHFVITFKFRATDMAKKSLQDASFAVIFFKHTALAVSLEHTKRCYKLILLFFHGMVLPHYLKRRALLFKMPHCYWQLVIMRGCQDEKLDMCNEIEIYTKISLSCAVKDQTLWLKQ